MRWFLFTHTGLNIEPILLLGLHQCRYDESKRSVGMTLAHVVQARNIRSVVVLLRPFISSDGHALKYFIGLIKYRSYDMFKC